METANPKYLVKYRNLLDMEYRPLNAEREFASMDEVIRFIAHLRDYEVYLLMDRMAFQAKLENLRRVEAQDEKLN